jgi:hypothetical protein
MNRFLFLIVIVLLFQNSIAFAQNIEITVLNKNSQPMPYAYILINNKPVEVSDTMGMAIIPQNRLSDYDTISVSYLGASASKIIYDESLKKNKKYCFYLEEQGYNLNEVVVTYQDIEKLLNKSTRSMHLLNYNCTLNAKFDAELGYPDQKVYPVSGTIEASNARSTSSTRYWNWFDPPIKFITNSDTTRLWSYLNNQTHQALNLTNLSLFRWQNEKNWKDKPIYSYLGEKDNSKVFRILYSKTWFIESYFQIIFYVDKHTRYIKSVEVEAFNDQPDKNNDLHKINLRFDCELFTHKKPKMNTIYLPVNIYYSYQIINKMQFDLKISDVSIK